MLNVRSRMGTALAIGVALLAGGSMALAATAPTMDPIPEVVDYASVASEVSAAGGTVVLLVGSIAIAFGLAWAIIYKAKSAVGG